MTDTASKLAAARFAVENSLGHHQAAYVNIMSLRSLHAEKARQFAFTLSNHPAAEPLALGNCGPYIYSHVRENNEFINISVALEIAEKDAGVIEALAVMDPLIAEVRRLEGVMLDEQAAYGAKLAAIAAAEEIAISKARASIDADPAVKKLREQAEATRPAHIDPPPFRGRVELPEPV